MARRLLSMPKGRQYTKPQTGKTVGGRKSTGTRRSGGYKISMPKMRRFTPGDAIKIFDNWEDIANAVSDPEAAKEKLQALITNKLKEGLKTNQKVGISLVEKPSEFTGGNEPVSPVHIENSMTKMSLANASDDRTVYKTVYHSGTKPSSAVKLAKKANGSGYRVLCDSLIDDLSVAERNILTQGCGFNQKQYHIPPIRSQVPVTFIKDLISFDFGVAQDSLTFSRALSNVLNIKQQFMIKNSSLSLPLDLTIHLVKIKDRGAAPISLNSLFVRTFYGQDDWAAGGDVNFSANKKGLVPKWYQHSPAVYEGDGIEQSASVNVSTKMNSLNYSPNFRIGANIVESFKRTIPPGDFWNFSHVHHCGSGVDIEAISRMTAAGISTPSGDSLGFGITESELLPFTYGIIFEAKGKTVEAYEIPSTGAVNTYLGSSPTYYSYEYKTSAYFAARTPVPNQNDNSVVSTPSFQVFETKDIITSYGAVTTTREKFIDQTNISSSILDPADAANVGKAFIPMSTSVVTSAVQHEGVRVPG